VIRTFVVPITGFTQGPARITGQEHLWRKIRLLCNDSATILPPLQWDSDWKAWAAWIARNADRLDCRVVVLGYSYGGGWGAVKLAAALDLFEIDVDQLVLCDAVGRSRWKVPNFLNLVSWDWRKVRLPGNVLECRWYFQREAAPFGQEVVAVSDVTRLYSGVQLHVGHSQMDEAREYHETSIEIIKQEIDR
jgi:pimeloyl-ACP methyl ester carboxylesterase